MLIQLVYAIPVAGEIDEEELKDLNTRLHEDFQLLNTGNLYAHKLLLCLKKGTTLVTDGDAINKKIQPYISLDEWPRHHSLVIYHSRFSEAIDTLAEQKLFIPVDNSKTWEWYLVTDS